MYATHIFDGIDDWPTHIIRMDNKKVNMFPISEISGPVYQNAARWLQEEKDLRKKQLEEEKK